MEVVKTVEEKKEDTKQEYVVLQPNDAVESVEKNTSTIKEAMTSSDIIKPEQNGSSTQNDGEAFKIPTSVTSKEEKTTELEKETAKTPELPYKEPWWSGTASKSDKYNIEILKNGCIISTMDLTDKPYYVFGRLPSCDMVLEHPSISRYHAVVQYRLDGDQKGFYLYDLGSTHGTKVNKAEIRPRTFYRLKVGFVIKFGGSSRLFVLQGPCDEEFEEKESLDDPATTENTTKIQSGQIFTDEEYESLKKVDKKDDVENEGISWGFREDAEEEQIDSEKFEELYSGVEFKDPKKTLRGYYEREGLELEYVVDETGPGHARVYHCRVRLPVDGPNGSAVYAEASVTGRKKDAVKECANEACKMLDAYGLLRQSNHESRKKRDRNWEKDDYYESDEDNYLDRTGTVETKRLKRMKKAGKDKSTVETYNSLLEKLNTVHEEIHSLQKQLNDQKGTEEESEGDSLDNFMNTMSHRIDKNTIIKLKRRIIELKKEEANLDKLLSLAKPADLPTLQSPTKTEVKSKKYEGSDDQSENIFCNRRSETAIEEVNTAVNQQPETGEVKETSKSTTTYDNFAIPGKVVRQEKKETLKVHKEPKNTNTTQHNIEPDKKITASLDEKTDMKPKKELENVKKKKKYSVPTQWEDANNPDFDNWMPPQDQSGDGRTKLNDKYGY